METALPIADIATLDWRRAGDGKRMKPIIRDGVLVGMRPRVRSLRDLVVFASGKSQYYISKLLNQFFNTTAFTFPTPLFFGLWTSALTAASTGSTAGETTYTGYGRVSVTPNSTNFSTSAAGSSTTNNTAITFGADTAGTPAITFVGIFDASSAGNMLYFASITSTTINVGDTPQINASALTASEA